MPRYLGSAFKTISNKKDMAEIGMMDGKVSSERMRSERYSWQRRAPMKGPIQELPFMNNSPWFSDLVSDGVEELSIPNFKRIPAKVSPRTKASPIYHNYSSGSMPRSQYEFDLDN